ncbi:sigma-70 family RNA polymerase sigma factor [Catenuloplanes niger JCM 9533]
MNSGDDPSVISPMDPATGSAPPSEVSSLPTHDEALRLAYETHGPILLNYLLRLTSGNRGMAEDILQETLMRAWNHPEARTADGQWSRGWLFTVARRIAIDHIRAAQGRPVEQLDERLEERHAAADEIDRLINTREIRDAVARLPVRLRSALIEIYFQERSVAEAAQNLAVPEGTVKSRTFYALRALHEDLTTRGFTL